MTKEDKRKLIVKIIEIIIALIAGLIGGNFLQNLYIHSQVANVTGDGNTVTINSVDDLVKNYNKLSEENVTLNEQNKQYFEDYTKALDKIETLESQLGDTPTIELKDLGLCVNGEDKNINKSNSYSIINGEEYFSRDFLNNLIADDTSITMKDDTLYLGKVIEGKADLLSQRIVDQGGCDVIDNATDAYGNTHLNAVRLENGNDIVYSLNEKYSLLKIRIAIDESSDNSKQCTISILADGKEVQTTSKMDKISTKEIEYKDLKINNCSRLEIKCSGDWSIYPLIYEAEVYN